MSEFDDKLNRFRDQQERTRHTSPSMKSLAQRERDVIAAAKAWHHDASETAYAALNKAVRALEDAENR
jgi:hypothetical protein